MMCGRYTITVSWEELLLRYYIDGESVTPFHVPRYNVSSGTHIPAITNTDGQNRIGPLKWGLIPFWAKDEKIGYKMINARAETVTEKPAYRNAFKQQRCIIPADGFYEWKVLGKDKQPMRILMRDEGIFSMAGLYATWNAPDGKIVSSCTIITTTPNSLMANIHDRMPVILLRGQETEWLDQDQKVDQLKLLLRPYDAEEMRAYPVGQNVGNVRNQGAELAEEVK